jgi:soluble lytic murein transglycosylase
MTQKFTSLILACFSVFALSASVCAQNQRGDDAILDMAQAFKRGDKAKLAQLLPQARGHVLEAQAIYWDIKSRLQQASATEVQDALQRMAGSYHEDRLRNDWLLLLGQRRDWASFAAEYPQYRMNDDREVRCYARLIEHTQGGDVADEVRRNWYTQRDADEGCTSAAQALYTSKKLTAADVWRKARTSMEINRPRAATDAVEIVASEFAPLVADINASPAKFLASKGASARKQLVTLALIKMATNDYEPTAAALQSKWAAALAPEQASWVWGVLGKQAALKQDSEANAYYARANNAHLNDDLLGWKVRAALRSGHGAKQWAVVLDTVNAMSDEARKDPIFVYWKARALKAASGKGSAEQAEAQILLESIASLKGFYEMLAMEELGQSITAPARPAAPTLAEKEAARLNAGLNRALYAITIGLRSEGVREWNYSTNLHTKGGMAERELLAAADFACQHEVWDRCINTSERTKEGIDTAQRFPMPFKEQVLQRCHSTGVDPAYVYGLIRQESRFIMDARSGVGASGLMQVMPATARWTAKKIGLDGFTTEQLNQRDTNITIGTAYLKLALDDFAGSMPLAAAAYNAGPNRPRAWRGSAGGPTIEAAAWAENVPFAETRDYVKKVLANTTMYAAIITGQPQSLKARLGTVGPREVSAPEVNKDLP